MKPFVWYLDESLHLFVKEGVYVLPRPLNYRILRSSIWTFVDSDHSRGGVPEHLVAQGTPFFVIYVASPAEQRWERLHKTTRVGRAALMNPWSKNEILRM